MPPGSRGLPIVGHTLAWRRDPLGFLRERSRRYGCIFQSIIYGYREITMLGPDANRFILSTHRDHFEWHGGQKLFFAPRLFGENLFLLDGDEHQARRKHVLPAFHGKLMQVYARTVDEIAHEYVARWAARDSIRLVDELRQFSFEVAARLLLGAQTREQTAYLSREFATVASGMNAFPRWNLAWMRRGRALKARRNLDAYFAKLLDARRAAPGDDLLGHLMTAEDDGERAFTDAQITSHLITMVLAAHDTTHSSLTWLLIELDRNRDVIDRLRRELGSSSGAGTGGTLLDRVLKEIERMHPAITGAPRRVVREFEFDGYRVPSGSLVYYSILFTHFMPEVFAEPERFDPDRFAPPRSEDTRTPFALVGFGGGPRACIGRGFARMEMKTLAAALLDGHDWSVPTGQDLTSRYAPTKCPVYEVRAQVRSIR